MRVLPRFRCCWGALLLLLCANTSAGDRGARLLISSRQFTPGTSGVGEVLKVDGEELERLRQGIQGNGTATENVTMSTTTSTTTTSSSTSSSTTTEENPVVVAASPQDSSRGTSQGGQGDRFVAIDRRKVPGKPEAAEGPLSFTGILNGLLDSFINDPAPGRPPTRQGSTTPQPSSEDTSVLSEDDELEEELSPEEDVTPKPSSPPPPSTTETSQEVASEEPVDDEEEEPLEDVKSNAIGGKMHKSCDGECRNIIFGLFLCDEIDNDAFCPESGLACCVNNPEPGRYRPYGNSSSEEVNLGNHDDVKVGSQEEEPYIEEVGEDEGGDEEPPIVVSEEEEPPKKGPPPVPQQQVPQQQQLPPQRYPGFGSRPPPYSQQPPHSNFYYPPPPQKNPMLMRPPPNMPLPCPRYCVKNLHEAFCNERLPNQFSCGMDAFCCSHSVNPPKEEKKPEEEDVEEDDLYRNEGLGQGEVDTETDQDSGSSKKIIGPCTEEVGSCVSKNIINIICFGHAQPTEVYTCPRSTMKCCARKTALPKDQLPSTPPPKLPDNTITRNSSSSGYPKPIPPPPGPPAILPQFVPHGPPHQHSYVPQNTPFQPPPQLMSPTHAPTPPPLAETPPPPIGAIPSPQYTSNANVNPLQSRIPARQPVGQYVCGVKGVPSVSKRRRRKRVVGGSDSLPGEWCWQVALINSLNQYLCGGALIGTQWVLTAAHCVTNIVRSGDAIYVRVGDHDLTSRYGSPGAQTLRVATTYIHHNHNSQTLDNDIALLKLQGNAALKEGVCLVCLPSRNHASEVPGKQCTVTGYGYMGESGHKIPLYIREASLPVVGDDQCVSLINRVTEKVFALPANSFCAGGDKSGNDACQGDGGSGFVCRADDPTTGDAGVGYYELTGLVSWGFGCGRENVPGVYVKVSSFIGWIHQIIRSN